MESINSYPQFYDLIVNRYSCRKYTPAPVPRDKVLTLLDAARLAPSACNRQPWRFVVVDTPAQREKIVASYSRDWVAPVQTFIVACGVHDEAWHRADGKDHTDVDVAIAVEHICLAAASLGLGTCWICNFDVPQVTEALALPEGVEPIAIIPVGYPDPELKTPEKHRKELDEIVKWEKF